MSDAELNSYRLTSIEDPSDEMLERIMADAAADARRRSEDANKKFFEHLQLEADKIRKRQNL